MKMLPLTFTRQAILLSLVCIFTPYFISAQNARDYFFPSNSKNASVFKTRIPGDHHKFYHSKTIFYDVKPGDSARMTTEYFDDNLMKGGQEQTLKVGESEITVVRTKANTSPGKVETFIGGTEVLFKMPDEGTKSEWSASNQRGAVKTVYVSEFATIKVKGEKVKAVKVSVKNIRKRSRKESIFYVNYYVAGIGLYKTTDASGRLAIDIVAEQKYEPNIPAVN